MWLWKKYFYLKYIKSFENGTGTQDPQQVCSSQFPVLQLTLSLVSTKPLLWSLWSIHCLKNGTVTVSDSCGTDPAASTDRCIGRMWLVHTVSQFRLVWMSDLFQNKFGKFALFFIHVCSVKNKVDKSLKERSKTRLGHLLDSTRHTRSWWRCRVTKVKRKLSCVRRSSHM